MRARLGHTPSRYRCRGGCGKKLCWSKRGVCTECLGREGLARSARAVVKRKEQDARGTVGDEAHRAKVLEAAEVEIARVRAMFGVPRSGAAEPCP